MRRTWIPKEIGGVRIPKKVRRAGARLPKSAGPVALAAIGSAIIAGIFAAVRATRRGGPVSG